MVASLVVPGPVMAMVGRGCANAGGHAPSSIRPATDEPASDSTSAATAIGTNSREASARPSQPLTQTPLRRIARLLPHRGQQHASTGLAASIAGARRADNRAAGG